MGKAKDVYPFQGRMVSAYQIAKTYGLPERVHTIKHCLETGMDAEEAIEYTKNNPSYKWNNAADVGGIRQWEINRLRKRIRPGDKLRVTVAAATYSNARYDYRKENCRVTGVYPYLVTLRRPCGLGVSKTYIDLIQDGIRQ